MLTLFFNTMPKYAAKIHSTSKLHFLIYKVSKQQGADNAPSSAIPGSGKAPSSGQNPDS